MNALLRLYPGDAAATLAVTVAVVVVAVVALAALLSRSVARRNPAMLYAVWLCALVCIPLGAAGVWAFQHSGAAILRLPVLSPEPAPATPSATVASADRTAGSAAEIDAAVPVAVGSMSAQAAAIGAAAAAWLSQADHLRAGFTLLTLVWAGGVALLLVRLWWGLHVLAVMKRELRPIDVRHLHAVPEAICKALGMRQFPAVMISRRLRSPLSLGIFRPVIVLPEELLRSLSPQQLRDVLVHECAHFLKRDHATGLLERVVQIVLWPHPAIYVLSRELARAREELCDNYVLRGGNLPNYARTLLEISQRVGPRRARYSATIGFLQAPRRLETRVASLLDKRRKLVTRMNRVALTLLVAAFALMVLTIAGTRLVPAEPPATVATLAVDNVAAATVAAVPVAALDREFVVGPGALLTDPSRPGRLAGLPDYGEPALGSALLPLPAGGPQAVRPEVMGPTLQPKAASPAQAPVAGTLAAMSQSLPRTVAAPPVVASRATGPAPKRASSSAATVDLTALVHPAVRIEPEAGNYWVSLRLIDELQPKLLVEPGKVRKVIYEETSQERLALEVKVDAESAGQVNVTCRLTVQVDPDTIGEWEAFAVSWRTGQWNLLAPRPAANLAGAAAPAALPPGDDVADDALDATTDLRMAEIHRLISQGLRTVAPATRGREHPPKNNRGPAKTADRPRNTPAAEQQ